ncbi:glycine-rich domain-containing protein-like [Massilia agilis]|uniref:Glycine-rich domain-containing protein-like n=1 Tax=Massilia agilis TaxID=1811226 RepID=A0ABT2DED7_9BURK|nr:glycine-rich domain-containing protein-like [Massilia agilis]MCS0808803.1 glycine-rich domain-containing protein-like [Massilia agilis]
MSTSNNEFATIASLDLDPIKVKLMHKESGEAWSLERAAAAEFEYRRFLYLMKKFPQEQASPSMEVDTFWHYHILDTLKYAEDCQVVFGYFLHHFPYVGLRGEDDLITHQRVGARMRSLYEDTFGDTYPFTTEGHGEQLQEETDNAARTAHAKSRSGAAYSMSTTGPAYSMSTSSAAYSMSTAGQAYSMTPSTAASLIRPRLSGQAPN